MTSARPLALMLAAAMAGMLWIPAAAQEPPEAQAEEPKEAQAEDPQAANSYTADRETLRAAVFAVLEAAGLELNPETESEVGDIVTAYRAFTPEDFGRNVATPAPRESRTYPFFQPQDLATGKYRLRATIEPGEEHRYLTFRAEILARAFNRITYEHQDLSRTSNGVIERYFHNRITAYLATPDSGDLPKD